MTELERIMRAAMGHDEDETEREPTPLQTEAYVAHLREVLSAHDVDLMDPLKPGDLVVYRDHAAITKLPSPGRPAVLYELLPSALRGHEFGMEHDFFVMEEYDCVLAVLHEVDGSAILLFTPANTRRLKRYTPTES